MEQGRGAPRSTWWSNLPPRLPLYSHQELVRLGSGYYPKHSRTPELVGALETPPALSRLPDSSAEADAGMSGWWRGQQDYGVGIWEERRWAGQEGRAALCISFAHLSR